MKIQIEQVAVRDESGRTVETSLRVERRILLVVDCGCWGHVRRRFELIVTPGGAYVRAEGDGFFRDLDIAGPLTLAIERAIKT